MAIREIHATDRRTNDGHDQERWLRQRFHQQDPNGYHTLLGGDLGSSDTALVVKSIQEILRLHPGQDRTDLHHLLRHADPEVVLTAAVALLGKPVADYGWYVRDDFIPLCAQAEHDPLIHDALAALERLAGDPAVPVPAWVHWYDQNPRSSAIQFLSACPLPWGWDTARCRRQVENPMEIDGRVISNLLPRLGLPKLASVVPPATEPSAAERTTLIAIWRRCLVDPLNRGTVDAMEELIALRDTDSVPRLLQIHDLLRSGASPQPYDDGTDRSPLPWVNKYEVEALGKKLAVLETPAP